MTYIFPNHPTQMQPLFFEADATLLEKSNALVSQSKNLSAFINADAVEKVKRSIRRVNSHYSHMIEGRQATYAEEVAHIEVEKHYLAKIDDDSIFSSDFICWIHHDFYAQLPEDQRIATSADGAIKEKIIPGALRNSDVIVGKHYPPTHIALTAFMQAFESAYESSWKNKTAHQLLPIIAASHHRLLWIHPFLDGNGRVARLFSHLAMQAAGIEGVGLWSPTRALARNVGQYKAMLQAADSLRRGDLDGRGNLSLSALKYFADFFIDACLAEIEFVRLNKL